MHEMSIAQGLLELIQKELAKHDVTTLKKVTVHHGRLAGVVPEALQMAWEAVTLDTPYQGAELVTVELPLKAQCGKCGAAFEPAESHMLLWACPQCGHDAGHTVLSGKELHLQSIEAE